MNGVLRTVIGLVLVAVLAVLGCGKDAETIIEDEHLGVTPAFSRLGAVAEQSSSMPAPPAASPVVPEVEMPAFETASVEPTFAETLAKEVDDLMNLLALPRVLFFPLVAAIAFLVSRALAFVARLVHRLGLRRRRLLAATSGLASLAVWGWALSVMAGRLLRTAPVLSLVGLGVGAAIVLVGLAPQVQNVAAGLGLAVRNRIDEGDQVTVGPHTGMVLRVGLTRVALRSNLGDTVFIPNRRFAEEAVAVGRARNSFPLRVTFVRERSWSADDMELAREIAVLCPFRDVHSRVQVKIEGDAGRVLAVEIQVWASRLLPASEQHLRRMLSAHLGTDGPDAGVNS